MLTRASTVVVHSNTKERSSRISILAELLELSLSTETTVSDYSLAIAIAATIAGVDLWKCPVDCIYDEADSLREAFDAGHIIASHTW